MAGLHAVRVNGARVWSVVEVWTSPRTECAVVLPGGFLEFLEFLEFLLSSFRERRGHASIR
ncbi:MAG: hypothetical protein VB138_11470 [Burkholderia sp.]